MAKGSFSNAVIEAIEKLAGPSGEASVQDMARELFIQNQRRHKILVDTLSDLYKAGRVRRLRQGVYAMVAKDAAPEIREVMWRVLRVRNVVTLEDLQEMAGASEEYAMEWLRTLERRELVTKLGNGRWQICTSEVSAPELTDNADKLKRIRRYKKLRGYILVARHHIRAAEKELDELEKGA